MDQCERTRVIWLRDACSKMTSQPAVSIGGVNDVKFRPAATDQTVPIRLVDKLTKVERDKVKKEHLEQEVAGR